LGTVAGDDTILVVIDRIESRQKVENEFKKLLEIAPKR
jgi:arginine repressor